MKKVAIGTGSEKFNLIIKEEIEKKCEGYECVITHFRRFLIEKEFDIVILSSRLKGEDTLEETIRNLKKSGKRIIFLTSNDTVDEIKILIKYGIFDFVIDEVRPSDIINLILKPREYKDIADITSVYESHDESVDEKMDSQKAPKKKEKGTTKKKFGIFKKKDSVKNDEENFKLEVDESYEPQQNVVGDRLTIEKNENNLIGMLEVDSDLFNNNQKVSEPIENKENLEVEIDRETLKKIDELILNDEYDQSGHAKKEKKGLFSKLKKEKNSQGKTLLEQLAEKRKAEGNPIEEENEENSIEKKKLIMKPKKEVNKEIRNVEPVIKKPVIAKPVFTKPLIQNPSSQEKPSAPRKIVYLGNKIITLKGLTRSCGCTHTCLLMAYSAKRIGINRVAIVQSNQSDTFDEMEAMFKGNKTQNGMYTVKGVDFYKSIDYISGQIDKYEVILFDMGAYGSKQNQSVEKFANKRIMVVDGSLHKHKELITFCKDNRETYEGYNYILPFGTKTELNETKELLEGCSVYIIPYCKEIFYINEETVEAVRKIIFE